MLASINVFRRELGRIKSNILTVTAFLACYPAVASAQYQPQNTMIRDAQVVPVQAEVVREKPLDARIVSMPDVKDKLEVIHHRSQLVQTSKRIKRMAIADPTVIELAPYNEKEISIIGLGLGSTTLTIWFEDDTDPLIILVKVIPDPNLEEQRRVDYGKLERKLALLFPNSKVYLIPLSYKIIVKGQAKDSEEAARILNIIRGEVITTDGSLFGGQGNNGGAGFGGGFNNDANRNNLDDFGGNSSFIVNMLQVPGEFQIMLRVRIAELNRSHLRRMGVDLQYLINDGRHIVSSFVGGAASTFTGIFEAGEATVLVDALASNGTATILSEPTLTVLSGHSASFLSGGEFAVPTIVGVGGAQGTSTTFRGFGTSLFVTPTVVDSDLIRMQIVPEFSAINSGNSVGGIPGLDSRRVQTTIELREGQTILIGGLLLRQRNTEVSRIPLLGEVPLIGPLLFNAKRSTEDETELLVLVSPEIVRPMDPEEVPPVPGFYVTHPTDHELYKYARTEGAPDLNNYQLAPYGNGQGSGQNVGYYYFNPAPATPQYAPIPTANQPGGIPAGGMQPGFQGGNQYPVNPTSYPQQQMMSPRPDANISRNQPMQGSAKPGNYRSGTVVKPASSSQYKPAPVQRSRTGR